MFHLVRSFNLPPGIENSLIVKLQNALNSLAKGNTAAACHRLDAFIHNVNAQAGKALTAAQAQQLLSGVGQVKAAMDCS